MARLSVNDGLKKNKFRRSCCGLLGAFPALPGIAEGSYCKTKQSVFRSRFEKDTSKLPSQTCYSLNQLASKINSNYESQNQSPSEANGCSAGQEVTHIHRKSTTVFKKHLLLVPFVSQLYPDHTFTHNISLNNLVTPCASILGTPKLSSFFMISK